MAQNNDNNNDKKGFASMDDKVKKEIQSEGGSANTPEQEKARQENIKKAQEARKGK